MKNTSANKGSDFVYYKLPDKIDVNFLSGEIKNAVGESATGFIIRPFDSKEKPLFLAGKSKIYKPNNFPDNETFHYSNQIPEGKTKEHYRGLVAKGLQAINDGSFSKVVLSRTKKIALPKGFSPQGFFTKICEAYPNAFVYLFSSPQYGTWLGASPEVLLTINGKSLKTMALAGTVVNGGIFTNKEKLEQRSVTGYIVDILGKYSENLTIKQPSIKKAGNIEHIITEIAAEYNGALLPILEELHPTPAVGGLPKTEAVNFILENEGYDRSLYSGYLGPVNKDKADIFVNLRCMQFFNEDAVLYAGAGIVNGSVPENEWQETENKMNTLLTHIK